MSEPEEGIKDGKPDGGPPIKPRREGGWAGDEGRGKRRRDTVEEDARLRVPEVLPEERELDDDLPVIPDLEEVQEEDLTTQIALPPTLAVSRIATYKQLESDLPQHTFDQLDGNIGLRLLTKVLSPESEIAEEDSGWEWEKLFAEMSSEIRAVWSRTDQHHQTTDSLANLS